LTDGYPVSQQAEPVIMLQMVASFGLPTPVM
jgi:hypothetical protein